jgi:molecular chaperone DnaJ
MFGQFVNVQTCPTCYGEGRVIRNKCSSCSGEGRVRGEETVKVKIPSGVAEGNYLTLRGQGNAGIRSGEAGNLIVMIEEEANDLFRRDGDDIYYELSLSVSDAILGTEVEVPTLKGKARLKIEAGTQPGKLLRLKGKGIIGLNSKQAGDQYVELTVYIPTHLTDAERGHIEALCNAKTLTLPPKTEKEKTSFRRLRMCFSE